MFDGNVRNQQQPRRQTLQIFTPWAGSAPDTREGIRVRPEIEGAVGPITQSSKQSREGIRVRDKSISQSLNQAMNQSINQSSNRSIN